MKFIAIILLALFYVRLCFFKSIVSGQNTTAYRLTKHLFDGYKPYIRPVLNPHHTVNVEINLNLEQVLEVNDERETIQINGWLTLSWKDELLHWDPAEFNNLTQLRVPAKNTWTPDIFFLSAAMSESWSQWDVPFLLMTLSYDGTIVVTPPAIISTSCRLNIAEFPYDRKICDIEFGSWMHTSDTINLTSGPNVLTNEYLENGIWTLLKTEQAVRFVDYGDQEGLYSTMIAKLYLQRRSLFYSFNFIIPAAFITVLSQSSYLLPVESCERIGLQITNFFAVVFFTQNLSMTVPRSSLAVPIMGYFLQLIAIQCISNLIANIYIIHLHYKDTYVHHEMSKWFEKLVCHYLARLICYPNQDQLFINRNFHFAPLRPIKLGSDRHLADHLATIHDSIKLVLQQDPQKTALTKQGKKRLQWLYASSVLNRLFLYMSTLFILSFYTWFLLVAVIA